MSISNMGMLNIMNKKTHKDWIRVSLKRGYAKKLRYGQKPIA
jgi:hypothetical protein